MAAAGKSPEAIARFRQRWHMHPSLNQVNHIAVPEDIERREEHSPCFRCESRGPCRHRPWMLVA